MSRAVGFDSTGDVFQRRELSAVNAAGEFLNVGVERQMFDVFLLQICLVVRFEGNAVYTSRAFIVSTQGVSRPGDATVLF